MFKKPLFCFLLETKVDIFVKKLFKKFVIIILSNMVLRFLGVISILFFFNIVLACTVEILYFEDNVYSITTTSPYLGNHYGYLGRLTVATAPLLKNHITHSFSYCLPCFFYSINK